MQRFPTGKYLGGCVILWGAMVAVTSSCKSYRSLMAVRFLLGAFESAISPSLILITSMWYKRNEVCLSLIGQLQELIVLKATCTRRYLVYWCGYCRYHRVAHELRLPTLSRQSFQELANHVSRDWALYHLCRNSSCPLSARQPNVEPTDTQ